MKFEPCVYPKCYYLQVIRFHVSFQCISVQRTRNLFRLRSIVTAHMNVLPKNPNSDLQNHLPKRVCPTASSPNAQKFEPLLPILPPQKKINKIGSCKVRVINVLFPKNLEQTPKMCWENFARVLFTCIIAG